MKTLYVLSLFALLFLFSSCDTEESNYAYEGLVIWAEEPATDGCGWLINISDSTFSPINLSSNYQTDSLHVLLDYKRLDSRNHCGWRQPGYAEIEITKIKNQ
ncbi:MAG: hypothetical protein AB7S69_00235 [Salinivirgaceae bacterium]